MEPPAPPPVARRSWPRRFLNRLEIDQPTFYLLMVRVWQFLAGPVTMLLIAAYFTPELQGYYYTFATLFAWQMVVELGMQAVVINLASHEWANLRLDEQRRIAGDPAALSRLVSLGRFSIAWYAAIAVVFSVAIGAGGFLFFAGQSRTDIAWEWPWVTTIILSGLSLCTVPVLALLDGCGQNAVTHRMRTAQAVFGTLAAWVFIPWGAGLWMVVIQLAVRLICEGGLIIVRYRRFLQTFLWQPAGERMDWKHEILPLQWRIAVQSGLAHLPPALLTPVMFHYHSPQLAGRMGMTWQALSALQMAALAWIVARIPQFNVLVARRDWKELDRVYLRLLQVSLGFIAAGALAVCGVVLALNLIADWYTPADGSLQALIVLGADRLAGRFLDPLTVGVFALAVVLHHVPYCQAAYLRAHRRDPLLAVNAATYAAISLLVWYLGSRVGPLGAGVGFLATIGLFKLPATTILWRRARVEWHEGGRR
jgi:hypothetical protein